MSTLLNRDTPLSPALLIRDLNVLAVREATLRGAL